MGDWAVAQEAVRQAVALAVDVPDYLGADGTTTIQGVRWRGTVEAGLARRSGVPVVDLELGAVRIKGHDETRYELVGTGTPAEQTLVPTYCGYRIFTVTVSLETPSQATSAASLGFRASMLRTRLRRGACHALLQAAEVAVVDIQPGIDADWVNPDTGRRQSKSMTDVRFGFNEHYTETDASMGDWISRVSGAGELTRTDGVVVDADFDTGA